LEEPTSILTKSKLFPDQCYGAINTSRQAAGSPAMVMPGFGFDGSVGGAGCSTPGVNQESSS
jgi:hypothetical protein